MKAARPPDAGSRFLWLFALAWAGGAVAYVPFLTILLPLRVVAIAGADSVRLLGLITFFGALAASFGNVLFGWLSDRGADRRPWVAAGLLISLSCWSWSRSAATRCRSSRSSYAGSWPST